MCLTLCLGFGSEKGSVYLVGMLRETRGVVVYGGVVLVERVVLNGGGGGFTPIRSRSRSPYIGSPLNASYAEFFRFMLQFLCLQMCVYGGGAVPQGGVGDRHLVTIPQGVVGDRLPWGGERQGGGYCASVTATDNRDG